MAGDWIPMRLDLAEDPAVMQMAENLQMREEYVVGCLHKVWSWASRQCHGGSVTGVTLASLERVTGVTGFVYAMRDSGWIEEQSDRDGKPVLVFPNWENWLANSAKKRLQDAKRQQNHRSRDCHAVVTKVSQPKRDKNVTTGEESTGEKKEAKASMSSCFETWWEHYPKKVSKEAASKAYAKALAKFSGDRSQAAESLLMESLPRFAELRKREPRFVPHPATWLNAGGWCDEVAAIAPEASEPARESRVMTPAQLADLSANGDVERFLR